MTCRIMRFPLSMKERIGILEVFLMKTCKDERYQMVGGDFGRGKAGNALNSKVTYRVSACKSQRIA